jgi:hypothetical protein
MRKRLAVLIAVLTLSPVTAEAAACRLEQATFRPRFSAEHFLMRSTRDGTHLRFEITIRRTGEMFPFRVQVDGRTGEGTIETFSDSDGRNTGIRSSFKLYDVKGLNTSPAGEIGHVAFYDLGRAFVDFWLRERRNPEPYTSPPSGVWRVSECRTH